MMNFKTKQEILDYLLELGYELEFVEWMKKRKTKEGLLLFIKNIETHDTIRRMAEQAGNDIKN